MLTRKNMTKVASVIALCAVASVACKKKEAKEDEPKAEATAEAAKAPEVTPEQKLEQDVEALAAVIDMPEDYIQAAEEEINADNLLEQVDKLEKELADEEKANPSAFPTPPAASSAASKLPAKPAVAKPAAPKPAAPKP